MATDATKIEFLSALAEQVVRATRAVNHLVVKVEIGHVCATLLLNA